MSWFPPQRLHPGAGSDASETEGSSVSYTTGIILQVLGHRIMKLFTCSLTSYINIISIGMNLTYLISDDEI